MTELLQPQQVQKHFSHTLFSKSLTENSPSSSDLASDLASWLQVIVIDLRYLMSLHIHYCSKRSILLLTYAGMDPYWELCS